MSNLQKGIGLTLISAVLNGSTYLFSSLILQKTSVENMLFFWFFWAILIYFAYFALSSKLKKLFSVLKNKDVALVGIFNAASALLWSLGIVYGGAALTAFIYRFEIMFTVLIGFIFLKEKITWSDLVGITIATFGAFLMAYNSPKVQIYAVFIILIGALISSIGFILVKRLITKVNPVSLAAARSFYLFLSFSLLGIFLGKITVLPQNIFVYSFLAAFFGAFLGFIIFNKSLVYYEVSKAIVVRSTEPFFAAVLAFIFLQETISANRIIGAVLIATGILILAKRKSLSLKN